MGDRRPAVMISGLGLLLVIVAGCIGEPTPASGQPSGVAVRPTPTSAPSTSTLPTPAPPSPTGPTPTQTSAPPPPVPPPTSEPSPGLDEVYEAMRPQNLRTSTGSAVITRGASGILFVYELVNTSAGTVAVPLTAWNSLSGYLIGAEQTWLEALEPGADLSACLPGAGRKETWYATGGRIAGVLGPPGNVVSPGRGSSRWLSIGPELSSCLPVGAYRYHVEYKPLDATGLDDVIAEAAIDLEIRDGPLMATINDGVIEGNATLALAADGAGGESIVSLRALDPGVTVTSAIQAAACGTDGPIVASPPVFTTTLGGTHRQRWTFTIHAPDARAAIAAGAPLSIRLSVGSAATCAMFAPAPDTASSVSPTLLPGAILAQDLGDGRVVRVSSETVAGPPSGAVDGLPDVTWNSGNYPPAWIEIDLGLNRSITAVRLLPAQLPTVAETVHRVYGRADGETSEVLLFELAGETADNRWLATSLGSVRPFRYIRVETVVSPSWVAWREIEIMTSD